MGILDRLQSFLPSAKVDIDKRFEKLREAISGTMSNFFMARDRKTDEIIGLKIGEREKVRYFEARFTGLNKPPEGKIAVSMNHPYVVKTFEHGQTTTDLPFMVMEYIEGTGLHTLIKMEDERLTVQRLTLLIQMAEAIRYVHDQEYIHRDICPRNFICSPDCTSLKLIDFGLTLPAKSEFMQPGNRTGTPLYMAPEVVRRRDTDKRLDVFSFGVTAYHLLTFRLPWEVRATSGIAALDHDTIKPTEVFKYRPNLNRQLGRAIMRCIEPNRNHRTQSMAQFLQAIEGVEREEEKR
jgi:serine/threonine-protein kinase